MRRKNMRIVIVGAILLVLAAMFFLGMMTTAPKSNDPVAMIQTVGQVSGVVGAIALMMIIIGLIGKKAPEQ